MKKVIHFCDSIMQRFLPDPFVIAVILTYVVFILAFLTTDHSAIDLSIYWGQGLWDLLKFMTQMCLVLLGGYIVASAYSVKKFLRSLAKIPRSSAEVVFATFVISTLACWLNWGLGLVVSAFVALEMARYHKQVSFRLLVATSYMGFIFWHGGLSGSIPLVVSTPENFSQKWMGGIIPITDTIFSNLNFIIIFGLISILGLLVVLLDQKSDNDTIVVIDPTMEEKTEVIDLSLSQKMDQSRIVNWVVVAMGVFYIYALFAREQFHFDLNMVNLLLLLSGLLLHNNTKEFLNSVYEGSQKLGPILVQYPLYAGIMGIIVQSGLASSVSEFFVSISTAETFPVYTFLSAGIVNFFVPSGGGQWAVQAPIVIEGAKQLGVPMSKAIMAVAWGDAWTNLAQPFWALPLLAIAGLGAKDIMGYCLMALIVSGAYISAVFLFL